MEGKETHHRKNKQEKYEELTVRCTQQAAAIGRREPYHLTYIRRYGQIKPKM